jgi:hypothetical protein
MERSHGPYMTVLSKLCKSCELVCEGFKSVYPAQILRTKISSSCWVFACYIFHVLVFVVYHLYLYQVYTRESDR